MKLRKLILHISDMFWYRILGGGRLRQEYLKRTRQIIRTLLPLFNRDEPYVLDGKWSWYHDENGYHPPISMVLIDVPLLVSVQGPEVGSWESARVYCRNKANWERANFYASLLQTTSEEIGSPALIIGWNDPIDPESLKLRLKNIGIAIEEVRDRFRIISAEKAVDKMETN